MPRHQAIAAGLALTLAFGSVSAPTIAFANTNANQDASDAAASGSASGDSGNGNSAGTGEPLPEPGDYDRSLNYEVDPEYAGEPSILMLSVNSLMASRSISVTPQSLSSEMNYFPENERGSN